MLSGMQRLIKREEGQDLIEYTLILAAIALAAVAGMNTLAIALDNALIGIGTALINAG
jgi:pilus assembly protein Flp/PilA